jgi:phosphoribosyl 1,2-cyclic phosphate 1,2-diphosphodiesterase
MSIAADLHCHTTISDGSDTIPQVIAAAHEAGLQYIAVTNHDTTKGLLQAYREGKTQGITVIGGIEISAFDFKRNRKVHILGYGLQEDSPYLQALCNPLLRARNLLSHEQLAVLREHGYPVTAQEADYYSTDSGVLYKQHIMQVLVDKGMTDSVYSDLYYRVFKNGGIVSRDICYVDAADAVDAVQKDGGYAVLAHPGQLDSWDLVPELAEKGLAGIEKYHPDHTGADCLRAQELAEQYGLFVTGGSDYHGKFSKKPVCIGAYGCSEEEMNFFYKWQAEKPAGRKK